MKNIFYIIIILFAVLVFYEAKIVMFDRAARRRRVFRMAQSKSQETGKPLVVIGDPHSSNYALSVDYGCGDLCMDIHNCPKCSRAVTHDINEGFHFFDDNSCVVFVSCTLEYANNANEVYNELHRIAGGDVFVVAIEANSLKTRYLTNFGYWKFRRKWRIVKSPPDNNIFYAVSIQ